MGGDASDLPLERVERAVAEGRISIYELMYPGDEPLPMVMQAAARERASREEGAAAATSPGRGSGASKPESLASRVLGIIGRKSGSRNPF
jgi:hypothetical protein